MVALLDDEEKLKIGSYKAKLGTTREVNEPTALSDSSATWKLGKERPWWALR